MADEQTKETRTEVYRREGSRWPILLGLIVAALIVATAVALGGRWAYRELTKNEPEKAAPASGTQNQPAEQVAPATPESDQSQPAVGGTQTENPSAGDTPLPRTGDDSEY